MQIECKLHYVNWSLILVNSYTEFNSQCTCTVVDTAVWTHHLDANKTAGEKARRQLHKNVESNSE